jgi:hypothetical protein
LLCQFNQIVGELTNGSEKSIQLEAEMQDVVIVSGVRTAVGTFGGSLKSVPVVELGTWNPERSGNDRH